MSKKSVVIYQTKNLSYNKIKSYEFSFELDQNLLLKHLKALGLNSQPDFCLRVEGEFSVDFDDDIAMPQIESLFIVNGDSHIEIPLERLFNTKVLLFDGHAIEDLIAETDDGSWYQDRLEAAADHAYDCWKDSQLEG